MAVGVSFVVAAAHLWLVARHGHDQPFHDQWGAEGFMLYRPWLQGVLTPEYFFFPHSEHRPAAMRLLAWGGFALNGQWDARVQLLANATIIAAFAGLMVAAGWRCVAPGWWPVVAGFAAAWFALPCCWENTLWGFQSPFYFLLLFGVLHVAGTCADRRLGPGWWLAQLAGLAGLFSIAAGIASAAALTALAVVEWLRGRRDAWTVGTALTNVALLGLAVWLLPPAASNPAAHAGSVGTILESMGYLVAWPVRSWWGLPLALPWILFAVRAVRRRFVAPGDPLLVALGAWAWLMAAALAYGRGEVPGRIAIRYFDVLAVFGFVNGLAMMRLIATSGRARLVTGIAGMGWAALLVAGAASENQPDGLTRSWARFDRTFDQQRAAIREFLRTDDPDTLKRDPAVRAFLPHFDFTVQLLRDPEMRRRLPPSLVPPLPLRRDAARSNGFEAENGARVGSGVNASAMAQRFESDLLPERRLPLLRFRVRGRLEPGGSELFLVDERGGINRPYGAAASGAADAWRTIHIAAPAEPVRVVAVTPAGARGISFEAPTEIGWLTWFGPKVIRTWPGLGVVGLVLMVTGLGAMRRRGAV